MASPSINIQHLKQLARIDLTPAEEETFGKQLSGVLEHFKALDSVKTDGIEPTSHAYPLENVWQEDVVKPGFSPDVALMNAPKKHGQEFSVPRVVEE